MTIYLVFLLTHRPAQFYDLANFGWLCLLFFMVVIQQMCGRIGMVTGKGLAGTVCTNYPKLVLYFAVSLLVITNTIIIGADLGAMTSSS